MAVKNSTTYDAQVTPGKVLGAGVCSGTVKVISTEYEASALAANDVINLFKLPKGSVICNMIISFDDLGTGTTLDIGDSNDVDRYCDGIDTATAAGSSSGVMVEGNGYVIGTNEGDDIITAKNLGASATGTIKVTCLYA